MVVVVVRGRVVVVVLVGVATVPVTEPVEVDPLVPEDVAVEPVPVDTEPVVPEVGAVGVGAGGGVVDVAGALGWVTTGLKGPEAVELVLGEVGVP